ncbi:hypothetical protein FAGAP_8494 [Fusarium agapanthi]|uniref:Chromo domain-containing protein n=1 Tax=Fusarium agapanthi TaxID=1803897 RepID=A0A9P5E527_9HYPO|nr:hypothetical protein FAGAP_8494 [Fusarium agapanthi]
MESASNAPANSSRPENTPTSSQRINRSSNSAAGSSSRQSEMNRLINNLANDVGYRDGDGKRSRENSLRPSARRGATPTLTPTPAQSVPVMRWADGSPDTEEPEEMMHIDSAQTLLNFWRRQGGRGPATGLREHRILRVLKSKESRKDKGNELLLCQWIGLPASDRYTTWMSGEEVIDQALGQWLEFKTGVDNIFG